MEHDESANVVATSGSHFDISPQGSVFWIGERCRITWSLKDVSDKHDLMGTRGKALLVVVKAKLIERKLFKRLLWIQYTEALLDDKIYTPAPTAEDPNPWPWVGIDRYPNMRGRKDDLPYSSLPDEQDRSDWGYAYEGRIKGLYDHSDADSVFVDWPSNGDCANWGHYSVLTLIGRGWTGEEWSLGSLMWRWSVDGSGNLQFGARPAEPGDITKWEKSLAPNYPGYFGKSFRGHWRG